jgi:hypothetical protein
MGEQVECYRCGKQVGVLRDGTYASHGWQQGGKRVKCRFSGRKHQRHSGTFHFAHRSEQWVANCLCGEVFLAGTYAEVEKAWGDHQQAEEPDLVGDPEEAAA